MRPVSKDAADAAQKQTYIDQYNQQLAVACNDMGFKYLNLPEVMKNDKGYAVDSYVDASTGASPAPASMSCWITSKTTPTMWRIPAATAERSHSVRPRQQATAAAPPRPRPLPPIN